MLRVSDTENLNQHSANGLERDAILPSPESRDPLSREVNLRISVNRPFFRDFDTLQSTSLIVILCRSGWIWPRRNSTQVSSVMD
jgi:hypothetical protein